MYKGCISWRNVYTRYTIHPHGAADTDISVAPVDVKTEKVTTSKMVPMTSIHAVLDKDVNTLQWLFIYHLQVGYHIIIRVIAHLPKYNRHKLADL